MLDIVSKPDPESLNPDTTKGYIHMTSTTQRYRAAVSQSASSAEKIADFWTQGSQRLSDYMLPGLPQVDLVPIVERYFEFVQRTVDISRDLTLKWAEAAGTLSGAAREQAESVGGRVREQAESARDFVHEQAGKAEQAEQELAREARKAEREQAKHAHDKARERYEGLTKAELSDQLDQRHLPKTGNADELVERLAEADSK
jgi:SAP domain